MTAERANPLRINNHRHNVTKDYDKHSGSRHGYTHQNCNFSQFKLYNIEQTSLKVTNRQDVLAKREIFLIFQLNTLSPFGLNEAL